MNGVVTSISDALKNAYEHHSTENELTTLGRSDNLDGTNTHKSGSLKMMMGGYNMGGTRGAGNSGTMSGAIKGLNNMLS